MKIGKLLKIYCDINDLGSRDMAKEIGVSHATISRIINSKSADMKTALKLIKWLFED